MICGYSNIYVILLKIHDKLKYRVTSQVLHNSRFTLIILTYLLTLHRTVTKPEREGNEKVLENFDGRLRVGTRKPSREREGDKIYKYKGSKDKIGSRK